jgi:hypothetical protein
LPALLLATQGWKRDPKAHALTEPWLGQKIRVDWRIVHIHWPSRPKGGIE